jgi:hypothetical protein
MSKQIDSGFDDALSTDRTRHLNNFCWMMMNSAVTNVTD